MGMDMERSAVRIVNVTKHLPTEGRVLWHKLDHAFRTDTWRTAGEASGNSARPRAEVQKTRESSCVEQTGSARVHPRKGECGRKGSLFSLRQGRRGGTLVIRKRPWRR